MNPRKYITDPKILLEEGKAIMTSSDESKFQLRVFAVIMVLSGHSAEEIGGICGYTKAAVTGWVRSVDKYGFESLKTKSSPGRPSRLSEEQMNHLDMVLQSNPNDYGFKVWDGPSLSAYIKKEFNIDLAVRQCQRIFHKLGFSLIRPQTFPSKGYEDTEKRKEFKKNQRNQG